MFDLEEIEREAQEFERTHAELISVYQKRFPNNYHWAYSGARSFAHFAKDMKFQQKMNIMAKHNQEIAEVIEAYKNRLK